MAASAVVVNLARTGSAPAAAPAAAPTDVPARNGPVRRPGRRSGTTSGPPPRHSSRPTPGTSRTGHCRWTSRRPARTRSCSARSPDTFAPGKSPAGHAFASPPQFSADLLATGEPAPGVVVRDGARYFQQAFTIGSVKTPCSMLDPTVVFYSNRQVQAGFFNGEVAGNASNVSDLPVSGTATTSRTRRSARRTACRSPRSSGAGSSRRTSAELISGHRGPDRDGGGRGRLRYTRTRDIRAGLSTKESSS